MTNFWDDKYSQTEHLYSSSPNLFLEAMVSKEFNDREPNTKKHAFVPADGDGRNGLWLANNGFIVDAFDGSKVAVEKANARAKEKNLTYQSQCYLSHETKLKPQYYDLIPVIFFHLPYQETQDLFCRFIDSLRPGGILMAELFEKTQINNSSGGPKDPALLYRLSDFAHLEQHFDSFEIAKKNVLLAEGPLHTGPAKVLQILAKK